MTNREQAGKNKLSGGVLLFTTSFLLYSLASPGNLPGDTEVRWSVTRQILRKGSLTLEEGLETKMGSVRVGDDFYSLYGLGQSLCMIPFAVVDLSLEKVGAVEPEVAELAGQFLASVILFPAIGAALVWLLYRLVLLLGYSRKVGICSSGVFAFATMNFHYSVNTHEQTQLALLLVLAILLMVKNSHNPRFLYSCLLCAALGLCLIFRLASAVMVLPIYLAAFVSEVVKTGGQDLPRKIGKWLLAGVAGAGIFIFLCGWYNYVRFGSFFESGYGLVNAGLGEHRMFESRLLPTLAAMLFSPGKSILLYNPVLLLLPIFVWSFYRRHKAVAVGISCAIVANLVLYGSFTAWAGDYAWSIRYQVAVLPLLFLPLVELFKRSLKGLFKTVIIALIVLSGLIQLASVVYNFNLEFVQNPNHNVIADGYVWDWSQSHLRKRFENIIRHAAGRRDFSSVNVTDEEPALLKYNRSEDMVRDAYEVNFFPFKARSKPSTERLFYPLLCLWLLLLAGFFTAAYKLVLLYARSTGPVGHRLSV